MDQDNELLTGKELMATVPAAIYIGTSPKFLENRRVTGDGPPFIRISSRCIRYRRCDLDAWVETLRRSSTSDEGPQGDAAA